MHWWYIVNLLIIEVIIAVDINWVELHSITNVSQYHLLTCDILLYVAIFKREGYYNYYTHSFIVKTIYAI